MKYILTLLTTLQPAPLAALCKESTLREVPIPGKPWYDEFQCLELTNQTKTKWQQNKTT